MKKTKPKNNKEAKIVETTTEMRVSQKGTALLIRHGETTYITAISLVEKLLDGTLKTKDDKPQKSISLGIISKDGIDNPEGENQVWLTKKNKCLYFVPEKDNVLVVPLSNVEKLLNGEYHETNFGRFE